MVSTHNNSITLTPEQFLHLFNAINDLNKSNIINRMSPLEVVTKIINDESGMMFQSWCCGVDVMN